MDYGSEAGGGKEEGRRCYAYEYLCIKNEYLYNDEGSGGIGCRW